MYPLNYIIAILMTVCLAYLTAAISCMFKTEIVMITMGAVTGICTLISLLAWSSWFDITKYSIIIAIAGLIIAIFGIVSFLVYYFTGSDILRIVYAGLATLIFCVYLMYDTQKILGGHRVELSPEEYLFGAIMLYVDIMIIFQHLLDLIGRSSSG